MGLDMYLRGEEYEDFSNTSAARDRGDIVKVSTVYELGYWRKHPDLHGYIVETFANGVDECQRISLGKGELLNTLKAVEDDKLPHTEGFFFGQSQLGDKERTIQILQKALKWMEGAQDRTYRDIYYQASW